MTLRMAAFLRIPAVPNAALSMVWPAADDRLYSITTGRFGASKLLG